MITTSWDILAVFEVVVVCVCVCLCVCAHTCPALCDPIYCSPPGSSVHGIFQAGSTEVGCHFLLQGIFLTQGLNVPLLCLLLWPVDSLPLVPPGKPLRGDGGPHLTYMALEIE